MFNWFKKKKEEPKIKFYPEEEHWDGIEEALWEIKDQYDLPTEEVINVVQSKRKNFEHMRKALSEKINKENL